MAFFEAVGCQSVNCFRRLLVQMYRHDFVFYENPALLVPVLGAFLDTRGIRHPGRAILRCVVPQLRGAAGTDRRVSDTAIKNLVRIVKEKKRGSLAVKMRPMLNKVLLFRICCGGCH